MMRYVKGMAAGYYFGLMATGPRREEPTIKVKSQILNERILPGLSAGFHRDY